MLYGTTTDEYCDFARRARRNELWWYMRGTIPYAGLTRPFRDREGLWWFQVKPLFAWPFTFFDPVQRDRLPRRVLLGAQWPVGEGAPSNSRVWMNTIDDLSTYGLESVASNKRRAIRKGIGALHVAREDPSVEDVARQACEVWNSHVQRTGWNRPMEPAVFVESWRELAEWPGTTLLCARDRETGVLCAWSLARVVDDVAYVDTLASHSDRLAHRPNDTIIHTLLLMARDAGARRAHYSLRSRLPTLEAFKDSLGFRPRGFPCHLRLRGAASALLTLAMPRELRRLKGDPDWAREPGTDGPPRSESAPGAPEADARSGA
jgi:hypothetical protein